MNDTQQDIWRGSIMIVTNDATSDYSTPPFLNVTIEPLVDPSASANTGVEGSALNGGSASHGNTTTVESNKIYGEYGVSFWRFDLNLNLIDSEQRVTYSINAGSDSLGSSSPSPTETFYIPSRNQDMNIMFYSCNGFSLGVAPEKFKGQLWNDVLEQHENKYHFHVMLGGGDQLYCDKVKIATESVKKWSEEKNPFKKRTAPMQPEEKAEIDQFYLWHYISWFGLGYFYGPHGRTLQPGWPKALAKIPMINIFDDHDIIDGFGSYTDGIMKSPHFSGIGRAAFKYYLLFQHCVAPEEPTSKEPSWVMSPRPGPYMGEHARSVYARLGQSIAFYGLDCRTERSHHQVCEDATYDAMFSRINHEVKQSNGQIKHLVIMLGVPIAYPRMVWLERILTSDLLMPLKMLTRKGYFSGLSNEFDDGIEILDDLDDHWCARHHKKERNEFVSRMQAFSKSTGVRITILGGDVHLAGVGRFYSRKPVPPEKDYRHMLNIISSAIVNTPPPDKLADFLNKRNKIHHFGSDTDEDMVKIFPVDVDNSHRNNDRLLPRRNWCSIIATHGQGQARRAGQINSTGEPPVSNSRETLYPDLPGTLSVILHMEKNDQDPASVTIPYEVLVPPLEL
ncbi:hypothetical protein AWJ20_2318 [Sugiyamaella lignohabitans]|uniref:PhoD-like phosphatase domain-containing protein n=1 Tax=Sugiyamaella lignohabitans TaxID=796027 RepID=A0A167F1L5_9ASCO|nr:uncharacterized protein AWJ20_2318 [Sugiyamaella lignohabitans]ANB14711.1 hypothetical protein AWJ20_2318 [Sugiyamaella lignohabitans]